MAVNEAAYRKLTNIIDLTGHLANGRVLRELSKVLSEEAKTQLSHEFERSRDPYGTRWAPLAQERSRNKRASVRGGAMGAFARGLRTGGSSKPLVDTGRLKNSFRVQALANGFFIRTPVVYAAAQNYGYTYPARTVLTGRSGGVLGGYGLMARSVTGHVLPARPMLPEGQLGAIWSAAFKRAADGYFKELAKATTNMP